MIRPVIPGEYGREERMYGRPEPPPMESAWERGLRTAKEMLRKSIKRKEQDIDFEEKKMNLSLTQEELDKENGYYARAPSPDLRYVPMRHPPVEYPPVARVPPDEYYGRRQVLYESEYIAPPRERVRTFRELPSHRMPDYYNSKYEDEAPQSSIKVCLCLLIIVVVDTTLCVIVFQHFFLIKKLNCVLMRSLKQA